MARYDPILEVLLTDKPELKARLKAGVDDVLDIVEEYCQVQRDRYPQDQGPVNFALLVFLIREIRALKERRRGRKEKEEADAETGS